MVSVAIEGDDRGLIFNNVAIRVSPDMRLEMHIDAFPGMKPTPLVPITRGTFAFGW